MQWETIHSYAEEIELWASLVINLYLLFSAGVFVFTRVIKSKLSLREQVENALSWGTVLFGFVFTAGLLSVSINPPGVASRYITIPLTAFFFIGSCLTLLANFQRKPIGKTKS
jgi:hypothetical protein